MKCARAGTGCYMAATRTKGTRPSILTDCANLVDRQVRAVILLFLTQAQAVNALDYAIHEEAAGQRHHHTQRGADQLADQTHTAQTAQGRLAEDPAGNPAPHAAQTVQRPHTQHIIDLPAILGRDEAPDEQA